MNLLFTCAGRRNYLINYFKEALKKEGLVLATDKQLTAPALVDADVAIQVPGIYEANYIPAIKKIVKENAVAAIISLNDLELPILSAAKKEIEALGARVILADEEAIKNTFDKWETVRFLKDNRLKAPQTFIDFDEAVKALDSGELKFPLVLKPRWGSASIGIVFPETRREFELAFELQRLQLGRTILAEASKDERDSAILIQEKLRGKEYGFDVLNDFEGNYIGTFVREKLAMRSGETDKAVSVIDPRFEKLGRKIGESLRHIGNLDGDVFEKEGQLYVLELNPRFGGGYPFSHEAGMNTAAAYIEWLKGGKDVSRFNQYKAGLTFSKCDRMLRVS